MVTHSETDVMCCDLTGLCTVCAWITNVCNRDYTNKESIVKAAITMFVDQNLVLKVTKM